jgi:hypothetical protein
MGADVRVALLGTGEHRGGIVETPKRVTDAGLRILASWFGFFASDADIGRWRGGEAGPGGVIQMPWFESSDEIQRFTGEMSEAGFVQPVPWMDWAQTPGALQLIQDPTAIADATRDDLVYLLTTIIRGERFSDGQIAGAFDRGTLLALARRAEALLASADAS